MVITTDIRIAVRTAVKNQKSTYSSRYDADKKAIADFLKSVKGAPALYLQKRIQKLEEERAKCVQQMGEKFGLDPSVRWINDPVAFRKAGGYPVEEPKVFTEHQVYSELILAKPSELKTILAKYGINWE